MWWHHPKSNLSNELHELMELDALTLMKLLELNLFDLQFLSGGTALYWEIRVRGPFRNTKEFHLKTN